MDIAFWIISGITVLGALLAVTLRNLVHCVLSLILFFLGIGPTIGGFGLYLVTLNYLPATVANLIAALEPALTAIWAYFLLHEQLTLIQLIGSVLVVASVILLRLGEGRGTTAPVAD